MLAALLTPWKLSMLTLLVLLCCQGSRGHWPSHKLRTWAALFFTSLGAAWFTPATGATPFLIYIALCITGGVILLLPPASGAQKAIGLIFIAMILFHFGAWLAAWLNHQRTGGASYHSLLSYAGWAQLFILLGWSLDNGLGKALRYFVDLVRRPLARRTDPVAYREGKQK